MKKILKKWWFWLIIVILFISIVGGGSSNSSDTEGNNTSMISSTVTAETTETNKTEQIIEALEFCCGQAYEKTQYRIEYDKNANIYHVITFYKIPGQIADELTTCILNNNLDPWYEVVAIYKGTSISLTELVKTIDSTASVQFSLYDKIDNKDTRFLTCSNGVILFDMATAITNL